MTPIARTLSILREIAQVIVDENDNILGGGNPIQVGGAVSTRMQGLEGQTDTYQDARLDPSTLTMQVIDYPHHEIHGGSAFTASVYQLVSDTDDRTAIGFKTPAGTRQVHMFAKGNSSSAALFIIREGPTVADNQGATQAVYNRNRQSNTATTVIDTSQTPDTAGAATYFSEADQAHVTENGTLLYQDMLAAEKKKGGGDSRGEGEFILKADTQYVFYMKSLTDDDNYHGLVLDWYEHVPKI